MKKTVIILFVITCTLTSFARGINDVKQILIGEWYEENHNTPSWTKYNADGTGSIMVSIYLFEESAGDFAWSLPNENTLVCVYPNNKFSRESLSIIDNNTILLDGKKYLRRGSKKASSGNSTKLLNNVTQGQNSNNSVWKPSINDKSSFIQAVTHPFGINIQMKDLTISSLKNFCNSHLYIYDEIEDGNGAPTLQINNCRIEMFGDIFSSEVSFFNSTYNPLRFYYFTTYQKSDYESELEDIVQNLKSYGIDLADRVVYSVNGTKRNEGYMFTLTKNIHGEIYMFNHRIFIILDYLNS